MAQNKKHITTENITEWLASTGFLFPRNEIELSRFEKLFAEMDFGIIGNEIDPEKIISNKLNEGKVNKPTDIVDPNEIKEYRMAARNGSNLPKHIWDKILKNQKKANDDIAPTDESNK